MDTSKTPRWDITRPSQDVRRMPITVTSWRRSGWCWIWRCRQGIRRLRCMRNQNCGYLFKLKQSANVRKLIGQIFREEEWVEAGQQRQGGEGNGRLRSSRKERRGDT